MKTFRFTKKNAIDWTLTETIHQSMIPVSHFITLHGGLPKCLREKAFEEIIGRWLDGSTHTLDFKTSERLSIGDTVKHKKRNYDVRRTETTQRRNDLAITTVHAVHRSDEPRGFQFFDPKVAAWFFQKPRAKAAKAATKHA